MSQQIHSSQQFPIDDHAARHFEAVGLCKELFVSNSVQDTRGPEAPCPLGDIDAKLCRSVIEVYKSPWKDIWLTLFFYVSAHFFLRLS